MAIKIIGVLGSPLPEGNTAILLDRALQGARDAGCDVEKIVVANLDFQACNEMMFCKEHETCIMDDDMQPMYQKFREMDGIILATPVMTMGIPGKLKSFMDRFQVYAVDSDSEGTEVTKAELPDKFNIFSFEKKKKENKARI